ncbi:MAG: nuclear transport factor 2 family protein [bacterium]|nr:nuclear transport factor 2 family protein [bacterium]
MITQQAVEDHLRQFADLLNQDKTEEASAHFAEDGTAIGSAGSYVRGKKLIAERLSLTLERFGGGTLKFKLIEFRALGDTIATAICRWTFKTPNRTLTGLTVTVYHEIDGRLLSVVGATTEG